MRVALIRIMTLRGNDANLAGLEGRRALFCFVVAHSSGGYVSLRRPR
jgi:hypothetical protein